jgi:hypothetical protein
MEMEILLTMPEEKSIDDSVWELIFRNHVGIMNIVTNRVEMESKSKSDKYLKKYIIEDRIADTQLHLFNRIKIYIEDNQTVTDKLILRSARNYNQDLTRIRTGVRIDRFEVRQKHILHWDALAHDLLSDFKEITWVSRYIRESNEIPDSDTEYELFILKNCV